MRYFLTCILSVFMFSACQNGTKPASNDVSDARTETPDVPFRYDGVLHFTQADTTQKLLKIDIEIADTPERREKGLMYRKSLPEKSGMLFTFDADEPQAFWMANTYIALDLIFANSNYEIVSIKKYVQPLSTNTTTSDLPAKYVVEVPAGFSDSNGIMIGQKITFKRNTNANTPTVAK